MVDPDYTPIICPLCNQEVRQLLVVEVFCPLGYTSFGAEHLRSSRTEFVSARWDVAQLKCGCEVPDARFAERVATLRARQKKLFKRQEAAEEPHLTKFRKKAFKNPEDYLNKGLP